MYGRVVSPAQEPPASPPAPPSPPSPVTSVAPESEVSEDELGPQHDPPLDTEAATVVTMEFLNVSRTMAVELLRMFHGSAAHVIDAVQENGLSAVLPGAIQY